jgi:rhodanese-related sulfurtransferase
MEHAVRPADLKERIDRGTAPPVLDVRRAADFDADTGGIPGALRGDPERLDAWSAALDPAAPVVVYCARGGSVSRGVAEALRARGFDARYLSGGIAAWRDAGFETSPKPASGNQA